MSMNSQCSKWALVSIYWDVDTIVISHIKELNLTNLRYTHNLEKDSQTTKQDKVRLVGLSNNHLIQDETIFHNLTPKCSL